MPQPSQAYLRGLQTKLSEDRIMGEKTVMFLLFIHISCVGESKRKEVKLKEAVNLKDSYSMFSKIKGYWALRFDKLQESEWEIHGGN